MTTQFRSKRRRPRPPHLCRRRSDNYNGYIDGWRKAHKKRFRHNDTRQLRRDHTSLDLSRYKKGMRDIKADGTINEPLTQHCRRRRYNGTVQTPPYRGLSAGSIGSRSWRVNNLVKYSAPPGHGSTCSTCRTHMRHTSASNKGYKRYQMYHARQVGTK